MAKVIGFDEKVQKQFTCHSCGAIVQYSPNEVKDAGYRDEGCMAEGLHCPNCGTFHRTNP